MNENKKLTFLVGAGCSIDQPSCLPAGKAMMEELIKYTCHESEVEKILQIKDLRFESLIEIIRDQIDKNLITIDYYGECDKPNIQHFFLAEMIKKGHFVMTTNFDFLIEYALLELGISERDIVPVITKQDFEQYNSPDDLLKQGRLTLYKIHGSPKNIITNENTKDSLVATIQAFGSNKEGLDIFQLEPFKRPLFENITKKRSLVVMGYSGSDDFDIVPTLKIIKNMKEIIWLDFLFNDEGKEKVYTLDFSESNSAQNFDKIDQILFDIYKTGNVEKIYRINVNTSRIIKELMVKSPKLSSEKFSLTPVEWLKNNLFPPSDADKFFIVFHIYRHFNKYDEAISCMHMMSLVSGLQPNNPRQAHAYLNIAGIYVDKAEYKNALEFYENAKSIYEKIKDIDGIAGVLNGMGMIFKKQGMIEEALRLYEEALELAKSLNNADRIAIILDNIANIYRDMGDFAKAMEYQEAALKVFGNMGMLKDRAVSLINIGQTYFEKKKYEEALNYFDQALKISEQLNDERVIGLIYESKASVYFDQKRLDEAAQLRTKAVEIFDKLGLKKDKAIALANLGNILQNQDLFEHAQEKFEHAYSFFKELNDFSTIAQIDLKLGGIYLKQGDLKSALKKFKKSLDYSEETQNLRLKLDCLNNIGIIYKMQGKYVEILELFEEALLIDEKMGDHETKAMRLFNMGMIYENQGESLKALEKYREANQINEKVNISELKEEITKKYGIIRNKLALKSDEFLRQRDFIEAINQLKIVIKICEEWKDVKGKATMIIKLARIYKEQGQAKMAINSYEEAAQIFKQSKEFDYMEIALDEMRALYLNLGKSDVVIKNLESLIQFYNKENLHEKKVDRLFDLGVIYSRILDFSKAMEKLYDALDILKVLGLETSEKADKINCKIGEIENQKKVGARMDKFRDHFNF